jgi:hypothetical protein
VWIAVSGMGLVAATTYSPIHELLYWLAPGELPVEAQFTEFQQGARGASLVYKQQAQVVREYRGNSHLRNSGKVGRYVYL